MKRKNPWKIIETKVVYSNPWMEVKEDKVIRPDKKPGIYGTVSFGSGVLILPIDKEGNVYLLEEYCYAVGKTMLGAISGAVDKKEVSLQAAKRELREEAGLTAKKWIYLGPVDFLASTVVSSSHMYLAQDLTEVKKQREGTEIMKVIKIPFDKAAQWVKKGKITSAGSIILITKANNYLNSD
jgi:8-oxo-dGTP pyrophosphatase MutT (NUDIX family)